MFRLLLACITTLLVWAAVAAPVPTIRSQWQLAAPNGLSMIPPTYGRSVELCLRLFLDPYRTFCLQSTSHQTDRPMACRPRRAGYVHLDCNVGNA